MRQPQDTYIFRGNMRRPNTYLLTHPMWGNMRQPHETYIFRGNMRRPHTYLPHVGEYASTP